jgi:choline dehydrogenase-like flavoprotein
VKQKYDLIVVGTGFAGAFFLKRFLERSDANVRVLVLERGKSDTKSWQLQNRSTSSIAAEELFVNLTPKKEWVTNPGFGGNSKCWWGGAYRMMPGDFQLKSRYGIGRDWPISYDDLESYYGQAEEIMSVSGPADSPMPRTRPFPLPPHNLSTPDTLLKKHFPDKWFHTTTARASRPIATRPACCSTGYCHLCPVDAKFTIQNGMSQVYKDPRITLQLECPVELIETTGGQVTGVVYTHGDSIEHADADLVVIAASALFNPHILLRSGFEHRFLGRCLHEQLTVNAVIDLRGVKSYNGSTVNTGLGYMFYEGDHRMNHAACIVETWNTPFPSESDGLRIERNRWTERMIVSFIFDDLPREDNYVSVSSKNPRLAETRFNGYSDYTRRAVDQIPSMIDTLSSALPIESVVRVSEQSTTAHIQGTVVMGVDPAESIVDKHLIHHQYRNLLVLGASAFPTANPASPTLTLSAMWQIICFLALHTHKDIGSPWEPSISIYYYSRRRYLSSGRVV